MSSNPTPVVIVTGARKGIGLALCKHYLKKDMIVVGCSRSESDLEHDRYAHHCLDVSDEKAVSKFVRTTVKQHGKIDILFNNLSNNDDNLSINSETNENIENF